MKKLYRSNDSVIFGICGGIGEYFGVDPTIIRVLWVASIFFTAFSSILIYIILAFIIPKKEQDID